MADPANDQYLFSPGYKVSSDIAVSVGAPMSNDGFQRLIYDRINGNLQRQANELVRRGQITVQEARHLVDGRNALLLKIRARLSPFGQLYSEILKPRASLKTFDQFLQQKGSIEAALSSVGKTRQVVDRIGVISRVAGPATIIISVSCTAFVIARAPAEDRARVASREIGGTVGSIAGGVGGMWAGCAAGASLASPSLVIPIWGEVTAGGACLVGGLLGGFGFGALGHKVGRDIGNYIYNHATDFQWQR